MNTAVKLLLVEDDDALRFIVKDNLEQNNYQVDVAENGQEAIELFENKEYQLIILDVMLPKIDGFKVADTYSKGQ
jgi:DNA-binding response OmpR family regulator